MNDLPINKVLPELADALAEHRRVILSAPPGSGKTTGIPPALLAADWLRGKKILMLEPRRLATRGAAARIADLLGEKVGETAGYRIRFENKTSPNTRIEIVTEGILTRRLQGDPELEGVGLVIFDEFHERSLHADLGLTLSLDVQEGLRDDLRILVMSATLDLEQLSSLMPDAPVITGDGQSFPVEIRYLDREPDNNIISLAAGGVHQALEEQGGDILVFLPGSGEIRRVATRLAPLAKGKKLRVHPLYGDLPLNAQNEAIRPDPNGKRRVVLATSIAETSLTIEGITTVIDTGWARRPRFDANSGLSRLQTIRTSKASADQRAGRAGRTAPGVCYRLWSQHIQAGLVDHLLPEILETDLAPLALQLAQWGVHDPAALRWPEPPPPGPLAQAQTILTELEALDKKGRITTTGQEMARLPLHPRLAHMLIVASRAGCSEIACRLAALLSERDPFVNKGSADIEERLRLLQIFETEGNGPVRALGGDPDRCRRILQAAGQWLRLLPKTSDKEEAITPGGLLSLAYPDRIGRQRAKNQPNYLLANGRAAKLRDHDPLIREPWLVAADLDAGLREGRIFLAAAVTLNEIEELQRHRIYDEETVRWEEQRGAATAQQCRMLGNLTLAETAIAKPDPEQIKKAMLEGIRQMGIACLPWDTAARELQARVLSLRSWQPDGNWPDLGDECLLETLEEWLAPWLDRISRKEQLKQLPLAEILLTRLDWPMQQRLNDAAPTHLTVPSGSRVRLQYQADGAPPVLAVRLQELFGLADTPTVGNGTVQVMLHLLSPARRPMQVTRDLRGFWDRTYPEVKKELAGRYPKHHWPDDPWSAQATARVKPRKRS